MTVPLLLIVVGVVLMIADALWARKRISAYCNRAGLEIRSLRLVFGFRSPFSPFRGKLIFCGTLKERDGTTELHAWFSSAGMISPGPGEPLEVKFSQ